MFLSSWDPTFTTITTITNLTQEIVLARPGLGIIKSIEFNSFRLLSIRLIVRHSGGRMQIIIDSNTNQTTGLSNSVLIDINAMTEFLL